MPAARHEQPNLFTLNAPATATTLTGVLTPFLLALAALALTAVPDSVPDAVIGTGGALVTFLVVGLAWWIGRFAQRWTYPLVQPETTAPHGENPELIDGGYR